MTLPNCTTFLSPCDVAMAVLLALVQPQGLGDRGADADLDLEAGADADAALQPGMMEGFLTLLGLGRVPLTLWLAQFLLMCAGRPQHTGTGREPGRRAALFLARRSDRRGCGSAGAQGVPARWPKARSCPRIIRPRSARSSIGRRATITNGVARAGSPARVPASATCTVRRITYGGAARTVERAGYLGVEVLLVCREKDQFYATALAERRLSPN